MFPRQYSRSFRIAKQLPQLLFKMEESTKRDSIVENTTEILLKSDRVFYNPVQEFNRDLSVAVITEFVKMYEVEERERLQRRSKNRQAKGYFEDLQSQPEEVQISILEPLSATGLRSIRYAKELPTVHKIVANDISEEAVETIKRNIVFNGVENIVETTEDDACMLMYKHKKRRELFTVVDLDPYGSPSVFLDTAVQCTVEGGLLLVTATDMSVLCGNVPETCYVKYGSVSLKTKACHEQGLRVLLKTISDHANRNGRYIVPLLSVSVDFYVRVFVKIYSGPVHCKKSTSNLSMVYLCTGCQNVLYHPLGAYKPNPTEKLPNQIKAYLPTVTDKPENCDNCNQKFQLGGPIWTAPIHDHEFVERVLDHVEYNTGLFGTNRRMMGMLSMIREELHDVPLYYCMDAIQGRVHLSPIKMNTVRSAIMNAGYRVSYSHAHKRSIKTNAPSRVVWDILRMWHKLHPVTEAKLQSDPIARYILSQEISTPIDLTERQDANPISRKKGIIRFPYNPAFWGPGSKSTVNELGQSRQEKIQNKNKKRTSKRLHSPADHDDAKKKSDKEMSEGADQ